MQRYSILMVVAWLTSACGPGLSKADRANTTAAIVAQTKLSFEPRAEKRPPLDQPVKMLRWLGLGFNDDQKQQQLTVIDNYPNADDPHLIVGVLRADMPPLLTPTEEKHERRKGNFNLSYNIEAERRKAIWEQKVAPYLAERGANAAYAGKNVLWALYLSDAPATAGPTVNAVLSQEVVPGYREVARETMPLDQKPGVITVAVKRGRCYGVASALTPTARRERTGGWQLNYTRASTPTIRGAGRAATVISKKQDGITKRGHFAKLFCPIVDQQMDFELSVNSKAGNDLPTGYGDVVVVLLARAAKAAEVRDGSCSACEPWLYECGKRVSHAGCKGSIACLKELNMTPAQCQ